MAGLKLTGGTGPEQASSFVTDAFAPGADRLILVFVASARAGFLAPVPSLPTVTGVGLVWQQVTTISSGDRRLSCFRSMGTPTSGPLTIDFSGEVQDHCAWSVIEYDGVDTGGADGAAAVVTSQTGTAAAADASVTLGPSPDPTRNPTVGAVMLALSNKAAKPVSPGTGFTELDEQSVSHTPIGKSTTLQVQDSPTSGTPVTWSWTGAENSVALAVEIKAAAPVVEPPEARTVGRGPGRRPDPPIRAGADVPPRRGLLSRRRQALCRKRRFVVGDISVQRQGHLERRAR